MATVGFKGLICYLIITIANKASDLPSTAPHYLIFVEENVNQQKM